MSILHFPEEISFTLPPTNCSIYVDPSLSAFYVSLFITVGILISYIPQYQVIHSTRSSYGISPSFLLLNNISGFAAFSNLILLGMISLPCCSMISGFECLNSQISLIQVGVQSVATFGITVCCLVFTDYQINHKEREVYDGMVRSFKFIMTFVGFAIIVILLCFFKDTQPIILTTAKIMGILSTITTFIQYFPQLETTYRLKKSGALSIKMMCIQFPGGLVWALTLILKPGSDWSSWLPYLSAALIQGSLLLMSVYYDSIYCPDSESEDEDSITGPLLRREGGVTVGVYT